MQKTTAMDLGEAYGRKERIKGTRRAKDTQRKPKNQLAWAHRGSQRLNCQSESLHGTDLGPLHQCTAIQARYSRGTPNRWKMDCP